MPDRTNAGRSSGSHRQALRILLLLQHLEARRGFTPTADVANELEVSERQIRRDAEALIDAGQPVELGLLEGRSAIRMRPRPTERVALNLGQRIALVSARNVFAAFEGTDLRRDLDGAVAAVAKTLEPEDRDRLRSLEKRIAYVPDGGVKRISDDPDAGEAASERLDELVSGLVRTQRVQATYLSSKDRKRTGLFAPHGIALYRHGLGSRLRPRRTPSRWAGSSHPARRDGWASRTSRAWTRSLPGAQRLRALVVFDEVYGFVPPHPANPPTKRPIVAMMKQARAFGVGVVIATQNPMDLDYRALGNAGYWCIGRLSTDADRARVVDAMDDARGRVGGVDLDAVIKRLNDCWFVVRDAHAKGSGLEVMHPRWAMSWMRGPMTRGDLQRAAGMGRGAAPSRAFASKEADADANGTSQAGRTTILSPRA